MCQPAGLCSLFQVAGNAAFEINKSNKYFYNYFFDYICVDNLVGKTDF